MASTKAKVNGEWVDISTKGATGATGPATLAGKTVVCFGDSLFGMYRGDTSAPAYIAAETGATVYNVGFGGTRMAEHPTTGYAAFSMWALAQAVQTEDWSGQEAEASSGSSYFPEQLAVLKGIDFSTVDIVVLHFGTNDFHGGVALDDTNDEYSISTICGALRFSLYALLAGYPKLRIYVSLPVYRYWTADDGIVTYSDTYQNKNGITLPQVCDALARVARDYNVPVIDGYHGLGVNMLNAATYLSDGVHHNELGRERFGRYIGACLTARQDVGLTESRVMEMIKAYYAEMNTNYENLLPAAVDTDGSVYNGVGYKSGTRLSSSGTDSTNAGYYTTGYIPVEAGDTIYLKNVGFAVGTTNERISFYNASFTQLVQTNSSATSVITGTRDESDVWTSIAVPTTLGGTDISTTAYFRLCSSSHIGEDSIITVNEPIS